MDSEIIAFTRAAPEPSITDSRDRRDPPWVAVSPRVFALTAVAPLGEMRAAALALIAFARRLPSRASPMAESGLAAWIGARRAMRWGRR
jgi:hypothetical protein